MRDHRLFYVFCALLTLSLAACSGGGESSTATSGTDSEATTKPAKSSEAATKPAKSSEAVTKPAKSSSLEKAAPAKEATSSLVPVAGITVDEATGFNVNSSSIPTAAGGTIGGINAFCEPSDDDHVRLASNVSPHVNWADSPVGTRSFALLAVDPDSPAVADKVNKEDVSIPVAEKRADFYHWVVADIPAELTEIEEGASSKKVVPGGKKPGKRAWGVEGVNSYGLWFKGDEKMAGAYGGWDGPCPPWNDERVHRYVFTLYALDVATLGLSGAFTGADVLAKVKGHTLAKASFTGIYSLNPSIPTD